MFGGVLVNDALFHVGQHDLPILKLSILSILSNHSLKVLFDTFKE